MINVSRLGVVLTLVVAATFTSTPAEAAHSLNRAGAVADAKYSWNKSYAHPYNRFGGTDCTNFVSQAWHFGGGLPMAPDWYLRSSNAWWRGHRDWSHSWSVSLNFADYHVNRAKTATYRWARPSSTYNPAYRADAILYDWGRGEGWSHLAIEVGWDGGGDYIAQHSKDRYGTPWNLGWRNERDPQVRGRMQAVVVHYKNGY